MSERTINILVAALGGEGGGVLADWIITAATIAGYPIQSTSVPGVAQRTGATTYYLEMFPRKLSELAGAQPILALTPTPGDIDVVVASELIEAARAMQNGFVTPARTTLIASTSRVYAIGERTAMADGRFDSERALNAAKDLAQHAVLRDFADMARASGSPINAVLFGALIAAKVLPIDRAAAEDAIRSAGKAADSNLRAFAAGFDSVTQRPVAIAPPARRMPALKPADFPTATQEIVGHGYGRLVDYQGERYARLYLDRLLPIASAEQAAGSTDFAVTQETGRYLALWMSYEDVIRVADLKTRGERRDRIRKEVRAKDTDIVRVADFLKPGVEEMCSVMPPRLGRAIFARAQARGWDKRFNVGMHIRSTNVSGFLLLRLLGALRWWRPHTWRFKEEQARIEVWLAAIARAVPRHLSLALEIANCGQLMKGYGDTHARAVRNFGLVAASYFDHPSAAPDDLAQAIAAARKAALADPEGNSLDAALAASPVAPANTTQRFAAAAE